MKKKKNTLKEIKKEGFTPFTEWTWRDGRIRLTSIDWDKYSGWLYVFVIDGAAMYVGETSRLLRERMADYIGNTGEQPTRLRNLIAGELKSKRPVLVYGRPEKDTSRRRREEARLRETLDPPWNL